MITVVPEDQDTTTSEDSGGHGQGGLVSGYLTSNTLFWEIGRLAAEMIHLCPVPRLLGILVCVLLGPGTKPGRHNKGCFPLCLQLLTGYNGPLLC